MKIDIIIPAYNVNEYIEECIDSVLNISNVNILLINDGSQEDMEWVKEKYKEHSNFYYYEKENGGLSSARNFGLEKSTSEYVMFLDSDDYLEKEEFIKIINRIKNSKKLCYLYSFKYYYEKEGIFQNENLEFENMNNILNEIFSKKNFLMVAWRYIIKREFLLERKLFFKEGIYHEDEEWTPRLLCELDIIEYLPHHVYIYRKRENSIMTNYNYKHIESIIEIIKILSSYYKEVDNKIKKLFLSKKIYSLYMAALIRIYELYYSESEIRKYLENELKKQRLPILKMKKGILIKYLPYFVLKNIVKNRVKKGMYNQNFINRKE